MKSLYTSSQSKKEILDLYDKKLKSLEIDYTYKSIETTFGKTNVIVTGNLDKPAIMLLHGSNGCAPIALEAYPNLSKSFCVYAIDVLAQPNKSDETRLSLKDLSYGQWVNELIQQLHLNDVTLAGFSFGGLIILKTLLHDESNIKAAYLAAPAYIVNGNPITALFKVFIPMKRYMKKQHKKYLSKFLDELFTDKDPFAAQFLAKVFLHFNMDFTPIPTIKTKEAALINTPITVFGAKKDFMFPGIKMIKRAKKIFPSLQRTMLFESSKHVQGKRDNLIIERTIITDNETS